MLLVSDAAYGKGWCYFGAPCLAKIVESEKKQQSAWLMPRAKVGAYSSTRMCYLVDPTSSHMLVSNIKTCMCKYELIRTVKLRMAH
jgi:hypothetical protein